MMIVNVVVISFNKKPSSFVDSNPINDEYLKRILSVS